MQWFAAVRRLASRISVRMLAFNLLLVFLPAAGFLYLDVYEAQLLRAQERSMVQQGRILAAALGERGELAAEDAGRILVNMQQQFDARLRVIDRELEVLADGDAVELSNLQRQIAHHMCQLFVIHRFPFQQAGTNSTSDNCKLTCALLCWAWP